MHFYQCSPELVVFDAASKETILLSSVHAVILNCFIGLESRGNYSFDALKSACLKKLPIDDATFSDSVDKLEDMNLIELA